MNNPLLSGIILASGFSRRMEGDKLLLNVGGFPMVERVIRAAQSPLIAESILVYRQDAVQKIGKRYGLKTVYNPHAEEGQSAAVKLGVSSAQSDADGFIFFVGDQPFLRQSTVNGLVRVFAGMRKSVVVPLYGGRRGHPVIFPSLLRDTLLRLEGDRGGRSVAEDGENDVVFIPVDEVREGDDIDTRADYERLVPSPITGEKGRL